MPTCPGCGAPVSKEAAFCPRCGTKLLADSPEEPTAPRVAEPSEIEDGRLTTVPEGPVEDRLYQTALDMVGRVAKLPGISVDREVFLRSQFKGSPYIDVVIAQGPQAVFTPAALRKKATKVINESTTKTAAVSFLSGLPSSPVTMVAAGGADVVQYFGFTLNLAQRLAYLFGEDELFQAVQGDMPDEAKIRVLAYLGAMFGAAGAAQLIAKTSVKVGENLGKQVAAKALTKTVWYPLVKKVGALVGQKITKKTVEKTITKAVPVVGGVVSGALTFVTFRPMGERLADVLERSLAGEFDEEALELTSGFIEQLGKGER